MLIERAVPPALISITNDRFGNRGRQILRQVNELEAAVRARESSVTEAHAERRARIWTRGMKRR